MSNEQLRFELKAKRDKLGMSLRDVADMTGVSFATISRFERSEGPSREHTEVKKRLLNWVENDKRSEKIDWSTKTPWFGIIARLERIENKLGIK